MKNLVPVNSKEELVALAQEQSQVVAAKWKGIVELYYFGRYFVSLFESRSKVAPLQIWNEYRNALDHFIRYLTLVPPGSELSAPDDHENIKKMRGHIQRALLDILKLSCHETDEWFEKKFNEHNGAALNLVDNGQFVPAVIKQQKQAQEKFLTAKVIDSQLGESAKDNKDIVSSYLDAMFEYECLRSMYLSATEKIVNAELTYESNVNAGEAKSAKSSWKQGLAFTLLGAVLSWLIACLL